MNEPTATLAPEPVLKAALWTIYRTLCYARNITIQPSTDAAQQTNDLMEALHDIPFALMHWDESRLETLRLHLRCFDHTSWPGSTNLEQMFDQKLVEMQK